MRKPGESCLFLPSVHNCLVDFVSSVDETKLALWRARGKRHALIKCFLQTLQLRHLPPSNPASSQGRHWQTNLLVTSAVASWMSLFYYSAAHNSQVFKGQVQSREWSLSSSGELQMATDTQQGENLPTHYWIKKKLGKSWHWLSKTKWLSTVWPLYANKFQYKHETCLDYKHVK